MKIKIFVTKYLTEQKAFLVYKLIFGWTKQETSEATLYLLRTMIGRCYFCTVLTFVFILFKFPFCRRLSLSSLPWFMWNLKYQLWSSFCTWIENSAKVTWQIRWRFWWNPFVTLTYLSKFEGNGACRTWDTKSGSHFVYDQQIVARSRESHDDVIN